MSSTTAFYHNYTQHSLEWEFVQTLAYRDQTPEDADFVQLMYTSRLRKYKHAEEHALARKRLVEEFGLSDNPDVLFSFAEALYISFRWADCFAITTRYVHPYSYVSLPDIASSAQKNSRTTSRSRTHNAVTYCVLTSLIPPAFKIIYFST